MFISSSALVQRKTHHAPAVMMTSSSSSLCRRHVDLHSPAALTYAPDYRRHGYQSDYLPPPPPPRVTSASGGLHGDAMTTHHVQQQQQQQLARSPSSFAIHELLGLHGPMLPHGMFDCTAAAAVAGAGGAGYVPSVSAGTSYQQTQFFPSSYQSLSLIHI